MPDDKEPPWLMYQRLEHEQQEKQGPPRGIQDLPGNFVRSGGQFAGQVWDAAKGMVLDEKGNRISLDRPLGATPTGIANLAMGIANKFGPGHVGPKPMTEYPEAVGEFYKQRYGSVENAANTALQDPVGTAADLSVVLGAGSLAARGASTLGRMANLPRVAGALGKTGEALNAVSAWTDPIRVGFNVAASPLRVPNTPLSQYRPEELYQSALKPRPSLTTQTGRVERMVQTGLDEGIPVSRAGAKKIWGLVSDLDKEVKGYVDEAAKAGITISPEDVAKRLDALEPQFQNQATPRKDLQKLADVKQEFLEEHGQATFPAGQPGPTPTTTQPIPGTAQPIPVDTAHDIKRGTYQSLKGQYGKKKPAGIEARKAIARGINEEVAAQLPEISELTARQSKALDLAPELERALARTGNYQLFSLATPATAGGVYAATGSSELAAAAAILRSVLDHPNVKSRLAINVYNGMKMNPRRYGPARMSTATARVNEYIAKLRQQTQTAPEPATP
jgi:hypothetical protein